MLLFSVSTRPKFRLYSTLDVFGVPLNHYQKCSHIHIHIHGDLSLPQGGRKNGEKCPFENFIRGPEEIVNLNDP